VLLRPVCWDASIGLLTMAPDEADGDGNEDQEAGNRYAGPIESTSRREPER